MTCNDQSQTDQQDADEAIPAVTGISEKRSWCNIVCTEEGTENGRMNCVSKSEISNTDWGWNYAQGRFWKSYFNDGRQGFCMRKCRTEAMETCCSNERLRKMCEHEGLKGCADLLLHTLEWQTCRRGACYSEKWTIKRCVSDILSLQGCCSFCGLSVHWSVCAVLFACLIRFLKDLCCIDDCVHSLCSYCGQFIAEEEEAAAKHVFAICWQQYERGMSEKVLQHDSGSCCIICCWIHHQPSILLAAGPFWSFRSKAKGR